MKKGNIISAIAGTVIGTAVGGTVAGYTVYKKENAKFSENDEKLQKMRGFYHLLVDWLKIEQENKSIEPFFTDNGYNTVAIYGMKELGERLYDELKDSSVKIQYIIDKRADKLYSDVDIFFPDEDLPEVNAIVVTATYYFNDIYNELKDKTSAKIVSLEEVINYANK